jgi:hypothetical protein
VFNAPEAPDPYQTAAAQSKSNIATATAQQNMNMVDQNNPYGSLKYSQTGTNSDGTPKYQADTTLTGTGQQLFDTGNQLKLGQQGVANDLLNSKMGAFSGKPVDLSYNGTTAALDKLNASRLDPQWAQNSNMQESKLAAQGLTPGMPGYDRAMQVFNQGKNDAYNSANLADYQTSANNALTEYNSPLQTYSTLVNGTAPANPTSGNVQAPQTNVAGTNVAGLVSNNYDQQMQSQNAMMGGLFGLGGTLGSAAMKYGMFK